MAASAKTTYLVQVSLMAALVVVVAFVPFLGYIPLVVIKATTTHIPVIIGAILLGPKAGGILGGVFGLTSILKNTMEPALVSFVFTPFIAAPGGGANWKALIIALVPRILVGVFAGLIFRAVSRVDSKKRIACGIAGLVGSLTNTLLVMGGIYVLYGREYAAAKQLAFQSLSGFIMTVIFTSGMAEAFVAAVACVLIARPLLKVFR